MKRSSDRLLFIFLTLCAASALPSARPLADQKGVVALVATDSGVDAYWLHVNELSLATRPALMRTSVPLSGSPRIANIVHSDEKPFVAEVAAAMNPVVVWRSSDGSLHSSAVVSGVVKDPLGTLIAERSYSSERLACGASQCAVAWDDLDGKWRVTFLNTEGSVTTGPFLLPNTIAVIGSVMSHDGLLALRSASDGIHATLVDRDGIIRFDSFVLAADPLQLRTALAVDDDGSRWIIAWVERPWSSADPSNEVHAVALGRSGNIDNLPSLLTVPAGRSIGAVALAWNGSQHLLVTSYDNGRASNSAYLLRFDRNLQPIGVPATIADQAFGVVPIAIGLPDGFAFGWNGDVRVGVISNDGVLAPLISIDVGLRRRVMR